MTIQRADNGGVSDGLTAIYTGKRDGNRMSGDVTFHWKGHWVHGAQTGSWYATTGGNPNLSLATDSHWCSQEDPGSVSADAALQAGINAARGSDSAGAFACFVSAADRGNASAQIDVADAYQNGITVRAEPARALTYYLKAAHQGNTTGLEKAAYIYLNGSAGQTDKNQYSALIARMWKLRDARQQICKAEPVFGAIRDVERSYAKDSGGASLGAIARDETGLPITAENDVPSLIYTQGSDALQLAGPFHTDRGTTSGEFLCDAFFVHGKRTNNTGSLSEAAADEIFKTMQRFNEAYRVLPLADGRYRVTLVPSLLGLSDQTYSVTTKSP